MIILLPLLAPPPPAVAPAVWPGHLHTAERGQVTVHVCVNCGDFVTESRPGIFAHLDNMCKECFGTGQPCPYPELHGAPRRCPAAEAVQCAWCHRLLEADPGRCPDHRDPCCGCCQPG